MPRKKSRSNAPGLNTHVQTMSLIPKRIKNIEADPKSILLTVPREVIISGKVSLSTGAAELTVADLLSEIKSQLFGGSTTTFYYQVMKIIVWGLAGEGTRVSLTDNVSQMEVSDLGSYSFRAKVGLSYSPIIQTVRVSSTITGNLASINSTSSSGDVDTRTTVRCWTSAANS